MKLILAIVNNDDAHFVNTSLTGAGFYVTKISSTGGFLLNGNSTFLLGVEENQLEEALNIIKAHSKKRVQNVPFSPASIGPMSGDIGSSSASVSVGGATVFILDVEKSMRF